VVVALVDLARSWREKKLTQGLTVTVRVSESAELKTATWLGVETSGEAPQPCKMSLDGDKITVALPQIGAAGILRLGR